MKTEKPGRSLIVPAWQFFHRAMYDFLMNLGLRVLSVERLDTHPIWVIRLRISAEAALRPPLEWPAQNPRNPGPKTPHEPLDHQIRHLLSRFLGGFGPPVPAGEISVIRKSGPYLRIVFLWPRGQPGFWTPARPTEEPLRTARGGLGDWAN